MDLFDDRWESEEQPVSPTTEHLRIYAGESAETSDGNVHIAVHDANTGGEAAFQASTDLLNCAETSLLLGQSLVMREPSGGWVTILTAALQS